MIKASQVFFWKKIQTHPKLVYIFLELILLGARQNRYYKNSSFCHSHVKWKSWFEKNFQYKESKKFFRELKLAVGKPVGSMQVARKRKSMKYPKTIPDYGTKILISYKTIPIPWQGDTSDVIFGMRSDIWPNRYQLPCHI